jgi:2-iminoacetate synthase
MNFIDVWRRHDFGEVARRISSSGPSEVRRALGRPRGSVDLDDFAALLSPAASGHLEEMAQAAHQYSLERFGRTMRMYAPLYLSNACANVCTYCGFSAHNKIRRKVLSDPEILAEARVLKAHGFESVLLVTGEVARVGRDYLANALALLRPHFSGLWIEVQPLPEEDYATLAQAGLSAVMVYQETYDARTYGRHHLSGPKADVEWRLGTPDRLGRAGVKRIGLGALYGLSDWRADAWFTGLHLRHVETVHWRSRTSVSFPRLRPHEGGDIAVTPFSERDLVQAACAFRLLSPEAELSLSTRESAEFRNRAFRLGFTSMSAGSRTNPGGYASAPESLEQFAIDDNRSPAEVASFLRSQGYEPVWKDWDRTYDGFEGAHPAPRRAHAAPAAVA